ncbi:hypothetical protein PUNSTDRAFT_48108 [Punctularia strigosozonata HHB-11173 SS5]|uniref:Uncharacterized protein n=1 Tax=Punctularia strigosozonata (strain HHB-11173) TaxID=741275 RepID=R7RZM2_PUNST|nr:uncharacterized protein PUNSTDRAFT_48108 [Punctularia strigosozonata HHB-11173 SS5]EIN03433.1 hypothetical protein PUNSTDRAFT_48108 [Punctularia strigosozonata HHB-11173 SS5]
MSSVLSGHYDVPAAGECWSCLSGEKGLIEANHLVSCLDHCINNASSGPNKLMQMSCLQSQRDLDYAVTIQNIGVPRRFRLCKRCSNVENSFEELVYRAQGIVVECNLLPLTRESTGSRFNLRQSIVLSGLDSQIFEQFLDSCAVVYNLFKRHLPPNSLFPLAQETIQINDIGYPAIRFTNPVFTKPDAEGVTPHTQSLKISDELDPAGILRKSQGTALYLDDNAIHTFRVDKSTGIENCNGSHPVASVSVTL